MQIRTIFAAAAVVSLFILPTQSQDAPSVADVARQSRQPKPQPDPKSRSDSANAPASSDTHTAAQPPKGSHVITNEDLPEHNAPDAHPKPQNGHVATRTADASPTPKLPAEYWKSQILPVKNSIAAQQRNIERLRTAIYSTNGTADTDQIWTERQRQKLEQLESMKVNLKNLQDRLEQLQEAARRQGYGNSVYDP